MWLFRRYPKVLAYPPGRSTGRGLSVRLRRAKNVPANLEECVMDYRLLGRSGLKVSALSIGALTFGDSGLWGTTDLKDAQRQIDLCLDHGVNLLDTSNAYNSGASESIVGEALSDGRRERMLVATKVRFSMGKGPNDRGLSRAHIVQQCEASLRRLKT